MQVVFAETWPSVQVAHVSAKARAWLGQISRSLRPHSLTPGSGWTHRRGWGWGWQRWGWSGGAPRRHPRRVNLGSSRLPKEEFPGARSTQDWPMGDTTTGRLHTNFHRGSTTPAHCPSSCYSPQCTLSNVQIQIACNHALMLVGTINTISNVLPILISLLNMWKTYAISGANCRATYKLVHNWNKWKVVVKHNQSNAQLQRYSADWKIGEARFIRERWVSPSPTVH